ncbi:hypothetical protein RISK_000621 [Rhodopirellula islandica]|uniref:Uncharacterized protein n=1 Tax=Rhodopirellula islandica TaxID=595434 RepID=A0A0J1BM64_RHOIS|nr:hypothetical protein RISK_000621 [Rhodopirellula islandica]
MDGVAGTAWSQGCQTSQAEAIMSETTANAMASRDKRR